ncbi:MAG: CGNR zinc finger domain-containing protein [Rubrobacter sp.]
MVEEDGERSVLYEPSSGADFAGRVLAIVARSVDDGPFSRLKACPDCRWVFYDKSRSRTRVWCGMYAGEGGRACGTIAKVRRYRLRRKAGE